MTRHRSLLARSGELAAVACVVSTLWWVGLLPAGAATPVVTISPGGALYNGENVSISVGPNNLFTPNAAVHILECADPGSTRANLPIDITTCDGNTVEAGTIAVNKDGSFSTTNYEIFQLPSITLSELPTGQPLCNATNACVLYVGQNQEDFTAPKIFSAPFSVQPHSGGNTPVPDPISAAPAAASPANGSSSSTTSPTVRASSSAGTVTPSLGSLPNTGVPGGLGAVAVAGLTILIVGAAGRRRFAGSRT